MELLTREIILIICIWKVTEMGLRALCLHKGPSESWMTPIREAVGCLSWFSGIRWKVQ